MSFRLFLVKTLVGLNFFPFIIIDRALTQNSTFSHNKKTKKLCKTLQNCYTDMSKIDLLLLHCTLFCYINQSSLTSNQLETELLLYTYTYF